MDYVLRNTTIVSDGIEVQGDLLVEDGTIAGWGRVAAPRGATEIDATGCVVLPGLVDAGLNLLDGGPQEPESEEGFAQTTRAALRGGVTTLAATIELHPGDDAAAIIASQIEADTARSSCDFLYSMMVPDAAAEWRVQARAAMAAGVANFWVPRTTPKAPAATAAIAFALLRDLPEEALVIAPVFDALLDPLLRAELRARAERPLSAATELFPDWLEAAAVAQLGALAAAGRARLLLNGISTARGLEALARVRPDAHRLFASATIPHLVLSDDLLSGPGLHPATWPPRRRKADAAALWAALEDGLLSIVTSGHKPVSAELRAAAQHDFLAGAIGASTYGCATSALHSAGIARQRATFTALSLYGAAEPARLLGIYPRKGTLQPGADADFVLFDPTKAPGQDVDLTASAEESRADFQSIPLLGAVKAVFLKGVLAVGEEGDTTTPCGEYVGRSANR